jgi:hypothetical protein
METIMKLETPAKARSNKPPSGKARKILKIAAISLAGMVAAGYVYGIVWKMTGSNDWKLKIDKDGSQVYTMKPPGSSQILVKGVTTWKNTLGECVSPFYDLSIQDDCGKWLPACTEYKLLKHWNPKLETNLQLYRWNFPFPFSPREILVQGQVHQDEQTKVVTLENISAQNAIPYTKGYVRVSHHHNVWTFTPKKGGSVEVSFIMDMKFGGFFPDLLTNLTGAQQVYNILVRDYPKMIDKYKGARFDNIQELEGGDSQSKTGEHQPEMLAKVPAP